MGRGRGLAASCWSNWVIRHLLLYQSRGRSILKRIIQQLPLDPIIYIYFRFG